MMFTLDKLLNALMKHTGAICDEGDSDPCTKLQMLFTQERTRYIDIDNTTTTIVLGQLS